MTNPLNRWTPDGRWLTPVEIEVLLKCYYSAEPYNGLRFAPAVRGALAMWLRIGYIAHHADRPDMWKTTDKGTAFVHALCSTPIPDEQQAHIDRLKATLPADRVHVADDGRVGIGTPQDTKEQP